MKFISILPKKIIIIFTIALILVAGFLFINNANNEKALNIQPDYSNSRTIKEQTNSIFIDFNKCTPDKRRIDVGFGSTTIAIVGKSGNSCFMRYGGEVENPNWNGVLPYQCKVPIGKSIMEFTKSSYGVNFQEIEQYCSK